MEIAKHGISPATGGSPTETSNFCHQIDAWLAVMCFCTDEMRQTRRTVPETLLGLQHQTFNRHLTALPIHRQRRLSLPRQQLTRWQWVLRMLAVGHTSRYQSTLSLGIPYPATCRIPAHLSRADRRGLECWASTPTLCPPTNTSTAKRVQDIWPRVVCPTSPLGHSLPPGHSDIRLSTAYRDENKPQII